MQKGGFPLLSSKQSFPRGRITSKDCQVIHERKYTRYNSQFYSNVDGGSILLLFLKLESLLQDMEVTVVVADYFGVTDVR